MGVVSFFVGAGVGGTDTVAFGVGATVGGLDGAGDVVVALPAGVGAGETVLLPPSSGAVGAGDTVVTLSIVGAGLGDGSLFAVIVSSDAANNAKNTITIVKDIQMKLVAWNFGDLIDVVCRAVIAVILALLLWTALATQSLVPNTRARDA